LFQNSFTVITGKLCISLFSWSQFSAIVN